MSNGIGMWKTLGALALAATTAAACSETETDEYGSLAAAITATGSDGATYRLPLGSYVGVYGATYVDNFPLDGDAAVISVDVPVGSYDVYLSGPVMGAEWPLERTNADMTTETVAATLVTPMPVATNVLENMTSSVVFQFLVSDGGTVTFAQGTIDVSINVDVQETTTGRAGFDGSMNTTSADLINLPPDMAASFPTLGESVYQQMYVNVTGAWVQSSSTRVCAPASWHSVGSARQGSFATAFEAVNGTVSLCVGAGPSPAIEIYAYRSGLATTTTWSSFAGNMVFFKNIVGTLPVQVFDGETLDLGALSGSYMVPTTSNEYAYTEDYSAGYQAGYDGPVLFSFTPTSAAP